MKDYSCWLSCSILVFSWIAMSAFVCILCFFFKQKTAYEIRISDWSSDVCSSDLPDSRRPTELIPAAGLRFDGLRNIYRRDGFGSDFIAVAPPDAPADDVLSDERRVGIECVSSCISLCSPFHFKKLSSLLFLFFFLFSFSFIFFSFFFFFFF